MIVTSDTVEDTIIPNLVKSKFDSYINSFDLSKSDPPHDNIDHVMPTVSDITEKNTARFISRDRGPVADDIVRSSLNSLNENIQFLSTPEHVPSQVHDPQ